MLKLSTTVTRLASSSAHRFQQRRQSIHPSNTLAEGSSVDHSLPAEHSRQGLLFVDSVFPVRLGAWDIRHYIGLFREESLLGHLESTLRSVKIHGFKYNSLEPNAKDGGVFVKFTFDAEDEGKALQDIVQEMRMESEKNGGLPSWIGMKQGNVWLVKGQPWREDLNRFASPMLKVAFDGPEIREERLYSLLRPYGRIVDLTPLSPAAAGTLRSTTITFRRLRAATVAHNCIHGLNVPSASPGASTRLFTMYERPIKAHVIRDWISGHPKLVAPVIVFFLGTLTYTIFDPVRALAVQGKMLDWFDYRKFRVFKWIRENTVDRLLFTLSSNTDESSSAEEGIWKERKDAEAGLRTYLVDLPNTLTFVHGPQGSGKSSMLYSVLKDNPRPLLVLDCNDLYKAGSDSSLLLSLARQTGYWPIFPFVNSLNNLIDIVSVGVLGQKAGLSSSLKDQVKQILDVVKIGLTDVSSYQRKSADQRRRYAQEVETRQAEEAIRMEYVRRGVWHDGRIDCIAGNGIMSELGVGDEYMRPDDFDDIGDGEDGNEKNDPGERTIGNGPTKTPRSAQDVEVVNTLPIVVIKNFATKRGRDDVLAVISQWAATLVENQIAHVIVVSDNRENAKQIAQALPSKPLNSIPLYDADVTTALSFVAQKLREAGAGEPLTLEQTKSIQRLGGRASDLETLIHKVHSGQNVEDAVEDIINRGVNELRKNAFGDDAEDAKSLPWTREQAWAVLKPLSKKKEITYHDVLIEFPFKGDETALRSMEHAELITIGTQNGRPSVIRPGRPVYRYVFERLVADPIFRAIQDIAYNEKLISSAEATVRACEEELMKLKSIDSYSSHWWSRQIPTVTRAAYIAKKMFAAETKLEALEKQNADLKKRLAKEM